MYGIFHEIAWRTRYVRDLPREPDQDNADYARSVAWFWQHIRFLEFVALKTRVSKTLWPRRLRPKPPATFLPVARTIRQPGWHRKWCPNTERV